MAQTEQCGVDTNKKEWPKKYLSPIKSAYLEEDPSPNHHTYGWVTT